MVPRVLVVQRRIDVDDVEQVVAADGDDAVALLEREPFDAVVVDLGLPPLDGWCVLAAVASWPQRPRLIATVVERADALRARALGADLCVLAGTSLHARAFHPAWQRHRAFPVTNSRRPTTSGVPA